MPAAALTLIVPGLDWTRQALRDLCFDLDLPGINALLDGAMSVQPPRSSGSLLDFLTGNAIAPVAACRLLGLGHAPGHSRWLCLDPVQLAVNERSIVIADPAKLELNLDEANEIAVSLASTLAAVGTIHVTTAQSWHFKLNTDAPEPQLPPLPEMIGRNGQAGLARDKTWRQLLNETQITLHQHPVNQRRASRGLPEVNSVWPWGHGHLSPVDTRQPVPRVFAGDAVRVGLARHFGAATTPTPQAWADVRLTEPTVIVLENLVEPTRRMDAVAWREAFADLDAKWFVPLAAAWRSGAVGHLDLVLPGHDGPRQWHLAPDHFFARLIRTWSAWHKKRAEGLDRLAAVGRSGP